MSAGMKRAEALIRDLAPQLDGKVRRGIPAFLMAMMEAHNAIISVGGGVGCLHIDANDPDQIHHMAIWRPGTLVCNGCVAAGALLADTGEEWLCDRCLTRKPGKVSASVAQSGRTLIWFGVCTPCGDALNAGLRGAR